MKSSSFSSSTALFVLLIASLTGCEKSEEATTKPELTCYTTDYVSLDGTSNANQYTSHFEYRPDGRPAVFETLYVNSNNQKTGFTYSYPDAKKVVIDQTFVNKPYLTTTLTLNEQGYATHREDRYGSGTTVTYDYEYDGQGYLAKIRTSNGNDVIVITAENGNLRSAKIGTSTYAITTDDQVQLKQPIPIGFLGITWPYLNFLGKPFRGAITAYKVGGYLYQVTNSLNVQGGLRSREINYTDPVTNKPVFYLKETYITLCL